MSNQPSSPIVSQPEKALAKSRVPFLGAAILTVAFYACAGLAYDPTHLRGSFLYASTIGIPALGILFVVSLAILKLLCRPLNRLVHRNLWMRAILVINVIISVGVVLHEWNETQPINLFQNEILSPVPASLNDLRITKFTSSQEGFAWLFAFKLSPEDFNVIRDGRHLKQIPVDLKQRQTQLAEMLKNVQSATDIQRVTNSIYPEDSKLVYKDLYVRPTEPEFYKADRVTVVTDRLRSIVYVYIDHYQRD